MLEPDFTTACTDASVSGVEDTELAGSNALDRGGRGDEKASVSLTNHMSGARPFRMPDFEEYIMFVLSFPRVTGYEVESGEVKMVAVKALTSVCMGNVNDVSLDVFIRDKPRSAAESKSFALPDSVKPIALVHADYMAGFTFDNLALAFAQKQLKVVVIVDFA